MNHQDFILLRTTTAEVEMQEVINFPAAIYFNILIPLQIVVLPKSSKVVATNKPASLAVMRAV